MEARKIPYSYQLEKSVNLNANINAAFDYLDNPKRLASHMSQSSWMMAGSHMSVKLDKSEGRSVGANIKMYGRVLGLRLSLEEVVIERKPPMKKTWETIGTPRLLILSDYRMGFELTPWNDSSLLRVFIDYNLPDSGFQYWLGRMLGKFYANWCCQRMAEDAASHFSIE